MKLAVALFSVWGLASSATAAANPFIGTWLREPTPGVASFNRLTFTLAGELVADDRNMLGEYQVKGGEAVARASSGETYT